MRWRLHPLRRQMRYNQVTEKEMSSLTKVVLVLAAIFAGYLLLGTVIGMFKALIGLVLPLLVVGGVVYALYMVYGRKALGGGRRTLP